MAKYLVKANYVGEGIKGLLKEGGTSRRKTVDKLVASLGGKVESYYYALGNTDLYAIMDMPDNVGAAALALKVNSTGMVAVKTIALLTPEEIDEAAKKSVEYRAPGA